MNVRAEALAVDDGGPASLPRTNGELVFAEPWEARALAMAVALTERLELPWDAFRQRLIGAVAADPDRAYYESWAAALEDLVISTGLATATQLDHATPTERPSL